MHTIAVVDSIKDWPLKQVDIELVTAKDYLSDPRYKNVRALRVLNLCRAYSYQRLGYYVSLVATARGHKPRPSQLCIEDLKSDSMTRVISQEMDELINKSLKNLDEDVFVLSIYFGHALSKCYNKLALSLVRQIPAPFLKVRFARLKDKWSCVNIFPIPLSRIPEEHIEFASEQAKLYLSSKTILKKARQKTYRYDLAILVNQKEAHPPSNSNAIKSFLRASEKMGFAVELLTPQDFTRIPEFDALFIRETTMVNNHTFRFARRAQALGLVVIDDPLSILRCSNKIFLAELLARYQLPMPKTTILDANALLNLSKLPEQPFVLKKPDGCFSNAVHLIKSKDDFQKYATEYFATSDLLIAQEFLPSSFDWRIGVLDNRILYVCKYYMVSNHWKIVSDSDSTKNPREGKSEAVPLSKVPAKAKSLALKVASIIGNGFYGVDIKEVDGKFYIIEINDNPSIDAGCEDELLGEHLYEEIISLIRRRVESIGLSTKA